MEVIDQLYSSILNLILEIKNTQVNTIIKAAEVIAEAIIQKKQVHILGTGAHSQLAAEEVLWRAGGLAAWNPIIDPGTSLLNGAKRSVSFERMPGYGIAICNAYHIGEKEGEVMVIIDAYGITSMSIDIALECKRRGVFTIGVTSPTYGISIPKDSLIRHPSHKNLCEVVDILVDSRIPPGDTLIDIEGFPQKVASASTMLSCFVMNALSASVIEQLISRNVEPPVFMSANLPGGDEANKRYEENYGGRARYML